MKPKTTSGKYDFPLIWPFDVLAARKASADINLKLWGRDFAAEVDKAVQQ